MTVVSTSPNPNFGPTPTLSQLKACQFSSWYPTFRNLASAPKIEDENSTPKVHKYNNVTIKSVIIKPLPKEFIEYLKCDGVMLPIGAENLSSFLPDIEQGDDADCWSSSADEDGKDEEETLTKTEKEEKKQQQHHFPTLNDQIKHALDTLGPSIPKLNWSCPKDVSWLNAETLKCCTVGDVYLLLKSSDFCTFDIFHALDGIQMNVGGASESPIEYELVLRKWSNLHASMEFRCFVPKHNIVAISQRNHTQHFPHLKKDYMMIRSNIKRFFKNTVQYLFADGKVEDYVFDVYIDKNERVWLIDFNIWADRTDSLLFKWKEILYMSQQEDGFEHIEEHEFSELNDENHINCENKQPEIRVVMNANEVLTDPLSSYRAPIDTVDLASDNIGSHTFQDFMAMCQPPSAMDSDESE